MFQVSKSFKSSCVYFTLGVAISSTCHYFEKRSNNKIPFSRIDFSERLKQDYKEYKQLMEKKQANVLEQKVIELNYLNGFSRGQEGRRIYAVQVSGQVFFLTNDPNPKQYHKNTGPSFRGEDEMGM